MSKAAAILMTIFTVFCLVAGPVTVSFADQPAASSDMKKEESKGVWSWIKDKVVWVGTSVKDGVVYVGSAIGNGFKSVWHWIWPSSKDDKKKDDVKGATTPTMKMGVASSPLYSK